MTTLCNFLNYHPPSCVPGAVARSVANQLCKQRFRGRPSSPVNSFVEKYFPLPLIIRVGCQLLAKESALLTGKLHPVCLQRYISFIRGDLRLS